MKSHWVVRNDRRLLYLSYDGFRANADALRAEVRAADLEICKQPPGSVLALADLRDTVASARVVEMFKESATRTKPYIHRLALIGIHGIKRFLAEMVARVSGREMRLFDTEEQAITWLLGDESDSGGVIGPTARAS